jgi:chemotaxis protein methyltransferase CheR
MKIPVDSSNLETPGREFAWTSRDFDRVQKLIYQRAGISLHDGKHAMVYSRLSRRLRDTGHSTFQDYLDWLESVDSAEWQEFVNALTTNLTSFFREQHHFELLSEYLRSFQPGAALQLWCAASSTGEEAYSILMTVLDAIGQQGNFSLLASDIDSRVLATAKQGVYSLDSMKGIDASRMQRFFMRGKGVNAGLARVRPELRTLITFQMINLIAERWPMTAPFDVVFCRNVMIYFDGPTQRRVLERLHLSMKPGGLLFVGHAENFGDSRDLFVLRGKTVYERI